MNKIILTIAFLLSAVTSTAWADGPVRAYGQAPQFSEDEQEGLVNADGAVEDPQAPMSTTARAYRNGLIGGKHLQKTEDDAQAAIDQAQRLQQQYPSHARQQMPAQYYPAQPQQQYYPAPQYAQPQYQDDPDDEAVVMPLPQVAGIVRSDNYPATRYLNDPNRPSDTCIYNSCGSYSRSAAPQPRYYQPAPVAVYVQPPVRYVAPRVVLPPRFGYDPHYGQYPLSNGYRGVVSTRPPAYRQEREVYYTRSY